MDRGMFQVASENIIDLYTDFVAGFIRMCIENVVPTVTIRTYPNQKPWIDWSINEKLKPRTMDVYKQTSYNPVRQSMRQHDSTVTKCCVAIQRLIHKVYVAGTPDSHGL